VVREVMNDLDITQHAMALQSDAPPIESPRVAAPPPITAPQAKNVNALSPAEAKAYMQQVVLKLKTWEQTLDAPPQARTGKSGSE
jgi:hypothetical protein